MSGEHESGQTSEKENAFGTKHFRCVVQGKVSCGGKICEDEGWYMFPYPKKTAHPSTVVPTSVS